MSESAVQRGAAGRLSIVIPAYNEKGALGPLLSEIDAALAAAGDYEIIVVDDGSDDGTEAALAERIAAGYSRLRCIRHERRYGQSAALHTGITAARGDWVATLDGDGQNDPRDILLLLAERDRSSDPNLRMVSGFRRRRQDSLIKRLSSKVANAVRRRVLADGSPDTGCGLKLIHRATFLALPCFDHMHRFLPALILCAGGSMRLVAVTHRPRRSGRSKYGVHDRLWTGIIDMLGVAWLRRRRLQPKWHEVHKHDG